MTWGKRFRRRQAMLESLWGIPALGAVLGAVLGLVVSYADEQIGAPTLWHYSPSTASTVLTSIVGTTAALTGFVVTVTVLIVQMATGTFSARIPRLSFRDPMLKATLAVLVGTLTFSFSVLRRIDDDFVPDLGVTLSGFLISLSLLVFIVFFDRCIRRLRPAAVAADVAPRPARRSRRRCASPIGRTSGGTTRSSTTTLFRSTTASTWPCSSRWASRRANRSSLTPASTPSSRRQPCSAMRWHATWMYEGSSAKPALRRFPALSGTG